MQPSLIYLTALWLCRYHYGLFSGLAISIGGLTESLVKHGNGTAFLPCVSAAVVAKTPPLSCASAAVVAAETPPLPCASTACPSCVQYNAPRSSGREELLNTFDAEDDAEALEGGPMLVERVAASSIQLLRDEAGNHRVVIPALKTLDFLLESTYFDELQVPSRPTAAVPMENPYCSCKLTRVRRGCSRRSARSRPIWSSSSAARSGPRRRTSTWCVVQTSNSGHQLLRPADWRPRVCVPGRAGAGCDQHAFELRALRRAYTVHVPFNRPPPPLVFPRPPRFWTTKTPVSSA